MSYATTTPNEENIQLAEEAAAEEAASVTNDTPENSEDLNPNSSTIQGFYKDQPVWVLQRNRVVATHVAGIKATFEKTTVNVDGLKRGVDTKDVFLSEDAAKEAFFQSRIEVTK